MQWQRRWLSQAALSPSASRLAAEHTSTTVMHQCLEEFGTDVVSSSASAAGEANQHRRRRAHGRMHDGPLCPSGLEGSRGSQTHLGEVTNPSTSRSDSFHGLEFDNNPPLFDVAAPRDAVRPLAGGGEKGGLAAAGSASRLVAACGGGAAAQRHQGIEEAFVYGIAAADATSSTAAKGSGKSAVDERPRSGPYAEQQPAKRRRIRGKQPPRHLDALTPVAVVANEGTTGNGGDGIEHRDHVPEGAGDDGQNRGVQSGLADPSGGGRVSPSAFIVATSASGGRRFASNVVQPAWHDRGEAVPNSTGGFAARGGSSRLCALTSTVDRSPGLENRDEPQLTARLGVLANGRPPEPRR